MPNEQPKLSVKNVIPNTSIILGAISLFADLISLGQLAYTVIVTGQSKSILLQLISVILVFLLGWGLCYVGLKSAEKSSTERILYVYLWAYIILACLSYLAVVRQLRLAFTFVDYITYVVIVGIQLAAFSILLKTIKISSLMPLALTLMTVSVIHGLTFLYYTVFVAIPGFWLVAGEWLLWLGWNLYAFPMLRVAAKTSGLRMRLR